MDDLAQFFADFAASLAAAGSVDDTMDLIVRTAVDAIEPCDHASISYTRRHTLISASSDDSTGPTLDRLQSDCDEGPCLDAIRTGEVLVCTDLLADGRFPVYGPAAHAATGVRSSCGIPLRIGDRIIGALNLFSAELAGFREEATEVTQGAILAAHAAPALDAALHRSDMAVALPNRDLIGQAKGIVMARTGVSEDEAFALLVATARRLNLRILDVAKRTTDRREPPA